MDAAGGQSPPSSSSETLMAALLTVPAARLASLARALAADERRLRCRLAFLLLSPPHFARALARLRATPLHGKAALLGRVLLRSLILLVPAICPNEAYGSIAFSHYHYEHQHHLFLPQPELDAALLLLAMCDSYSPAAASPSPVDWHAVIVDDVVAHALSVSGLGPTPWAALGPYVDAAAKARRFADVVSSDEDHRNGVTKDAEVRGGASYAAAVRLLALPPAAASRDDGGAPCAICREEMVAAHGNGDVCALRPCGHRFHWRCARRWLARRNTCPCCRAELPARDAPAEARRLWRAVERTVARGGW